MKSVDLHKLIERIQLNRAIVLLLLLVLVGIGAVPGYWTQSWSWSDLPKVTYLNQIRNLRKTGLDMPNWQTIEQKPITLGGHEWSYQILQGDHPKPITVLLLPQADHKDQPQVEWVDIEGVFHWKSDSYTQLNFNVQPTQSLTQNVKMAKVTARFFRAWTEQQTFAVVQWYAWPEGGNWASSRWFWQDQLAQLSRQRVPWVAVCIQIPTEPLGNLEASRSLAESLSKQVQAALMTEPFAGKSSAL